MSRFVFLLSKGEVEPATRCFQFAKVAHAQGYDVFVFLLDDGVYWAESGRDLAQKTKTGDCAGDYLPYLVENEVQVGVCTPCAQARGLNEADFHSNMMLDGAPHLFVLSQAGQVFNF